VIFRKRRRTRNVILISVDTLRADHLGCYGYGRETSPNIDALAGDSALFSRVYAPSPWTLPSHVSMMTALFGVHHQVYQDTERMDPSIVTLADLLRCRDFLCSAVTGGGFVSAVYGFSKGFDSYYEGEGGVNLQDSARRVSNAAVDWIDRHREKSFLLFIHTYQPHNPYISPHPYNSMFLDEDAKWRHLDLVGHLGGKRAVFKELPDEERRNVIALYDGEVRYTDERLVGPLLQKLRDLGLYDRTLIVFASDHGEEFYEHGGWGHGQSLYDESLRVPLLVKFPGSKYAGRTVDHIVSLVDIMPTILDELGVEGGELGMDGKSLLPLLEGKESGDRRFFADVGDNVLDSHIPGKAAVNEGRKKVIFNKRYSESDMSFFLYPPPRASLDPVELYDLGRDPSETRNAADEHAELARNLVRMITDMYDRAAKRETGKAVIDEKLKEQLRALGYIR